MTFTQLFLNALEHLYTYVYTVLRRGRPVDATGSGKESCRDLRQGVAHVRLAAPGEPASVVAPLGDDGEVVYRQPAVAACADVFGHPCSIESLGAGSRTGLRALVSAEIRQQFQLQCVWLKLAGFPSNPSVLGDAQQAGGLFLCDWEVSPFAGLSDTTYPPPPLLALLVRQFDHVAAAS